MKKGQKYKEPPKNAVVEDEFIVYQRSLFDTSSASKQTLNMPQSNSVRTFSFIDLFAGCGGLSLGFELAGFTPVLVNEIVPQFCETYRKNRNLPNLVYFVGDICQLNAQASLSSFDNVDLVCGGPPCQGFSTANRQRIIDDPRNQLYKEFLKFLCRVRPKFFVMENVRGMKSRWGEIIANFNDYLNAENNDYQFSCDILKAEDFGVPQHRERFIVIGNRMGIDPKLIFSKINDYKKTPFVLRDALFGLPSLGVKKEKGHNDYEDDNTGYTSIAFDYPITDFYKFINGDKHISYLYNHKNRYNNPRDVEIFTLLPQGGNSLHPSIEAIMPYKRRNGIFKDKYYKLQEEKVCRTITSHMKFDCNMYIHPWYSRGLSPREAARIQTFPDDFIFYGAQNSWYAQIGNAVPVKLAEAIGNAIYSFLT